MGNVFNRDGFQWFIGVVEDRDDPEKLGRCKVRIYGHNSQFKSEQPTEDLPWSVPIQPITSAAISGIGSSPIGPLPGTWVVGFYLDGNDMQQPAFFGTIGSSSAPTVFQETLGKSNFTFKDNDDTLKDQSGQAITRENRISDGSKAVSSVAASFGTKVGYSQNTNKPKPSLDTIPAIPKTSYEPPEAKISGYIVPTDNILSSDDVAASAAIKVYPESGEPTDEFGYRYGTFQIASYLPATAPDGTKRQSAKTSPLQGFLDSEQGQKFNNADSGLFKYEIGSEEFNESWRNGSVDTPGGLSLGSELSQQMKVNFANQQLNYLFMTFCLPVVSHLGKLGGPSPFSNSKPAVFFPNLSMVLSLVFEVGVIGAAEIIYQATKGKPLLSSLDIVELVQEYKLQNSDQVYNKLSQTERDQIKVEALDQKEKLIDLDVPKSNPTSIFGDYGSGFNLSVGLEGTPDDKLTYNGNDPTVYDRINNERIRRGLPGLTNPRPTGEGNREVRSTFGGTTDRFGNRLTSEE